MPGPLFQADKTRLKGTKADQYPSALLGTVLLSGFVLICLVWAPQCSKFVP